VTGFRSGRPVSILQVYQNTVEQERSAEREVVSRSSETISTSGERIFRHNFRRSRHSYSHAVVLARAFQFAIRIDSIRYANRFELIIFVKKIGVSIH